MTSRVNGAKPARFELPALDLNFGNITDGTNIPPPLDSPKVPTPPATPPLAKNTLPALDVVEHMKQPNGNTNAINGNKRSADEVPLSPAASPRQGSLRRFLSKNKLNTSYTEGQLPTSDTGNVSLANSERPQSRGAGSLMSSRTSRRGSWFRMFRGDSKRSSMMLDDSKSKKNTGPPPPMIPELKELEKDEGSLGRDLFKNI